MRFATSEVDDRRNALAADSNGLNFFVSIWAKQGNLTPYGNGAYGDGSTCIFSGSANRLFAN